MSSAICFNLDRSKILSSSNGLTLSNAGSLNSLPNNKILGVTKLEAFADSKSNDAKMRISLFDTSIFTFLTVFSKAFFFRVLKSQDCVVQV